MRAKLAGAAASHDSDWLGLSLYQSANRIAHLYFIFNRLQTPTWLVNLYFTDDPIGPTNHEAWDGEVLKVKGELGPRRTRSQHDRSVLAGAGDSRSH